MTDREILLNEIKHLLEDASNHELDFVYVMLLNMRRDTHNDSTRGTRVIDKRAQTNYEHSQQLRITVCVHPAA